MRKKEVSARKMSTKLKKLYSKADIEDAKAISETVRKYYSRKSERRLTVQIRISNKWHLRLKEIAQKEEMMLSFLIDKICEHFFKHYKD